MICVGDDWAEDHHDVCVLDEDGRVLVSARFDEGVEGLTRFHEVMAGLVSDPSEVAVGIETDRGLWVHGLVAAGYAVYAINPRKMAGYRSRFRVSGAKSDAGDARVLADLVRTDRHLHRQVAGDSGEALAIRELARGHQTLVWDRTRHANRLRSKLREYHPAALDTFDKLTDRDCLAILAIAPTPAEGASLSRTRIRTALKRAGRQRRLDERADEIKQGLKAAALTAPEEIVEAMAATTRSTVAILEVLNRQISELEHAINDHFEQHPNAEIYLSMPGMSHIIGARVLGGFGDDPDRYANPKSRRNYAGTSPLTIASGKAETITSRWIYNNQLHDAVIRWAFCSLTVSPGAKAFYTQRRQAGDSHYAALKRVANRLISILHGCLHHHTTYDEHTAWAHRQPNAA